MAIGVSIQHAKALANEDREVRTDHLGFIGVVLPGRWPDGAHAGDFIELTVDSLEGFESHPTRPFFDNGTRLAVQAFFTNGGAIATLFGLCVHDAGDLRDGARFEAVFAGLRRRLEDDEEIALLNMPPLAWLRAGYHRGARLYVEAHTAVTALLLHCQSMNNRFLLIDSPRNLDEAGVAGWVEMLRAERDINESYGALYYPWLANGDLVMPPAGAVAGVFARTDLENAPFGVRVAPANQPVRGVTHQSVAVPWRAGRQLLAAGINPILEQPGRGLVLWGARTLSQDPKWNQVSARRIVSFITERVRRDAEWILFEQMRPELWETLARMVRARLDGFWSAGLLTGTSAGSEYLVQCDEELNPPAVRDAGQIHFKVLLRPVSTTEFIEVELQLGD